MKTKQNKIDQYVTASQCFASHKDFEKHLRESTAGFMSDYIVINGVLYTMQEFDSDGRIVTYYNKRLGLGFNIETTNRYKSVEDAKVDEPYEMGYWRNDIQYAE